MKLTYMLGSTAYTTRKDSDDINQEAFNAAVQVIAAAYGIHEKSVVYLLQNGYKQSLQDAYAGPRAKAIKDGEDDATVQAVIIESIGKRQKSINKGELSASISGGRDPIKSVGLAMFKDWALAKGKTIPKGEKGESFFEKWLELNMASVEAEIKRRKSAKGPELSDEDLVLE